MCIQFEMLLPLSHFVNISHLINILQHDISQNICMVLHKRFVSDACGTRNSCTAGIFTQYLWKQQLVLYRFL